MRADALRLIGAAIALSLLWNLPVRLGELDFAHLGRPALEVVLLFGALALVPFLRRGKSAVWLAWSAAAATLLVVVLKAADLGVRTALGRPLSPWLDLHLAPSLVHLLTGTVGGVLGWLVLLGVPIVAGALFLAARTAVRHAQVALEHRPLRAGAVAVAALLVTAAASERVAPDLLDGHRAVATHASATLLEQWRRGRAILAALPEFRRRAEHDAFRDAGRNAQLAGLGGADVLLMYVESYGRSALDDPRYAKVVRPRLEAFASRLADAGLHAASGWLVSPTAGGQSWLAHGTMQSGLWLPHHRHYELLLTTDRLTLGEAFTRAGYRTIAVKPAITMPWPEGQRFGYDRIYAAADLGYQGRPYNWVTMPDQFTLSALERTERADHPRAPLFAEVSLISSHAPWTPIPPVLDDWSVIGDGKIFSRWADLGDPPEVLWRDAERVRRHYALALDYVLGVLASYAERFVDRDTLLLIVGDHQPSPLITGEGASRDVPIHVVTGDPGLLEPFLAWGVAPGLVPEAGGPVRRMDAFRDWFLGAFGAPPPATATAARR